MIHKHNISMSYSLYLESSFENHKNMLNLNTKEQISTIKVLSIKEVRNEFKLESSEHLL